MVEQPDVLDIERQRAMMSELGGIKVDNVGAAVMEASKQIGGRGLIPRYLKAMRGPGKINLHEYIYYRMFDPSVPEEEMTRFLSFKMRGKHHWLCNRSGWIGPTLDKVVWDMILGAAGVPCPEIFAVHKTGRPADGVRWTHELEDVVELLRDPDTYPSIAKPNYGGRSLGLLGLEAIEGDNVHLRGGEVRPVEDVAHFLHEFSRFGYLFQRLLKGDPRMQPVTGGALASFRALVLLTPDGPRLENATLKIPRAGALADNFWRGNMMGAIDKETGQISRAIIGTGLTLTTLDKHPDTDADFVGFQIPDWEEIKGFVLDIAQVWPAITMQGWDIGLTDQGPVPLELNFGGDVNLQQLAHGRGALTPEYCEHLRFKGWKKPLPH